MGTGKFNAIRHFNPHSRTGSDFIVFRVISTSSYFNPHSRTGSDLFQRPQMSEGLNFNPHSRTGSDGAVLYGATDFMNFNPHSRTGSDDIDPYRLGAWKLISIHTPARGVTTIAWMKLINQLIFQSTLPHGE